MTVRLKSSNFKVLIVRSTTTGIRPFPKQNVVHLLTERHIFLTENYAKFPWRYNDLYKNWKSICICWFFWHLRRKFIVNVQNLMIKKSKRREESVANPISLKITNLRHISTMVRPIYSNILLHVSVDVNFQKRNFSIILQTLIQKEEVIFVLLLVFTNFTSIWVKTFFHKKGTYKIPSEKSKLFDCL